jgi:hypothetical protein
MIHDRSSRLLPCSPRETSRARGRTREALTICHICYVFSGLSVGDRIQIPVGHCQADLLKLVPVSASIYTGHDDIASMPQRS